MIWQELGIKVPEEYVEPTSYLFNRYGYGLAIEDAGDGLILLTTYLPSSSRRRMARIEVGINLVRILQPMGELTVRSLEDTDWESAWKSHFSLLRLGRRLVIRPSWIDYQAEKDEVVIELDPGMAFGTGYHPTTAMCLEALEELVHPGAEVLDLGTGSGILAIAASRLGANSVLALDTDPTSVKVARRNFKSSGVKGLIRLVRGTLPHPAAPEGCFDLATSNITSKVIQGCAPHLLRALRPGGTLIASGIMKDQQESMAEKLVDVGFRQIGERIDEDWVALLLSKP